MLKAIFLSLIMITGLCANAERIPAKNFGLPPETGYLEAVTPDEHCDPRTDVLLRSSDSFEFITKCDGSNIGWITRYISPSDLRPDDESPGDLFDMEVDVGTVYDRWGNRSINVYVCDITREQELAEFPQVQPAKDAQATYKKMMGNKAKGKTQTVQLFFNEFLYSGKCIGGVKGLNGRPRTDGSLDHIQQP